jgi:glycyl-tRNA synthetase
MGVADRGCFDLQCHARGSGKSFEYLDKENHAHVPDTATGDEDAESGGGSGGVRQRKYIPHCIEPSMGVDRLFLALLTSAYTEEEVSEGGPRRAACKMCLLH